VESSKIGVIDCLTAGFFAVYRKPVILIVPIIIDLLLCFVPRVSPQPIINNLIASVGSEEIQTESAADDSGSRLSTSVAPQELLTLEDLDALGAANLAGILGTQVQSYLAFPSSKGIDQRTINVESWQGTILSLLLFIFGSVAIGTIYLEMLAQHIKTGTPWPIRGNRVVTQTARLFGYIAIITAIYGAIAIACLSLITIAYPLLPVIVLLGVIAAFTSLVYFFVGEAALFLEDIQPIQALKSSILFAKSHFLPLIGFVVLTTIIGLALQIALGKLASYPLGLPPAIILNACVMTALTIAVMKYYWHHTKEGGGSQPQP